MSELHLFVAAFALDALMMLGRWLKAVYFGQVHLLTVGWITQLAIGVAAIPFVINLWRRVRALGRDAARREHVQIETR